MASGKTLKAPEPPAAVSLASTESVKFTCLLYFVENLRTASTSFTEFARQDFQPPSNFTSSF